MTSLSTRFLGQPRLTKPIFRVGKASGLLQRARRAVFLQDTIGPIPRRVWRGLRRRSAGLSISRDSAAAGQHRIFISFEPLGRPALPGNVVKGTTSPSLRASLHRRAAENAEEDAEKHCLPNWFSLRFLCVLCDSAVNRVPALFRLSFIDSAPLIRFPPRHPLAPMLASP